MSGFEDYSEFLPENFAQSQRKQSSSGKLYMYDAEHYHETYSQNDIDALLKKKFERADYSK